MGASSTATSSPTSTTQEPGVLGSSNLTSGSEATSPTSITQRSSASKSSELIESSVWANSSKSQTSGPSSQDESTRVQSSSTGTTSSMTQPTPTINMGPEGDVVNCPSWDSAMWTPLGYDGQIYAHDSVAQSFYVLCQVNLAAGEGQNPDITDFQSFSSNTLQSCIDRCAQHNEVRTDASTALCSGVTFDIYDTCFLKQGLLDLGEEDYPLISGPLGYASAILQSPYRRHHFINSPSRPNSPWHNATTE